jgi:hypothetical protein
MLDRACIDLEGPNHSIRMLLHCGEIPLNVLTILLNQIDNSSQIRHLIS